MIVKKFLQTLAFIGILAVSAVYAGDKVNINKADAATLAKELTEIGEKRAEAIIAYRKKHGDFKNVAEITNVKGIGEGILKKNADRMTVGNTTASSQPQKKDEVDKTDKSEKDAEKKADKPKDKATDKSDKKVSDTDSKASDKKSSDTKSSDKKQETGAQKPAAKSDDKAKQDDKK